jgi:NAD(P)-dependent dehydrogenase (short-subunit alcohol dehydrogenase family)
MLPPKPRTGVLAMADSKTVLTTGVNSGIGLAAVIEMARRGHRSVGSVRSTAKARTVQKHAREAGVAVETVILDVTDAAACERVIDQVRPDALVNNAGFSSTGAVEDVGDDEARLAMETMVFAPMRLARLALPHMRERGWGRVVNVSSIYGRTTTPLTGWYQASKHALEALSDAMRVEVASSGVGVVLVEPGGFRTGIWDTAEDEIERYDGSRYQSAYRRSLRGIKLTEPLMGNPETVAKVIAGAIGSGRPKARYLVGYDAQAVVLYDRLLPSGVRDRLSRIALGL